ncbi:MAG TPA: hypothetical protein ENN17_05230 [bacterium]|nr:hypothetical protein [bacterium]
MRIRVFLLILTLFAAGPARTETGIRIEAAAGPSAVRPGDGGRIRVSVSVPDGFHISDASEGLFSVTPPDDPVFTFGAPAYPPGERDKWGSVYRGRISVSLAFRTQPDAKPGVYPVRLDVMMQPCDEVRDLCYPPSTQTVETVIELSHAAPPASPAPDGGGMTARLSSALERGSALAFLFVFLGGLLTSLTPCVYPMIPITIAVIGAQATGGRLKGFVLSLFYVLGISLTFSTLGVIAARTGALFGAFTQHPVIQAVIAAIFLLMGLSMLGAFVIQLPSAWRMKLHGRRRGGFIGAVLTGIVAGLVVSPCVSPLLVVILTWVARSGSVLLGFGLLFAFAWGIGVLFIVLGTFSGVLKTLPKSGGWTEHIERAFGWILIALAILFLKPVLSGFHYGMAWSVFLVILGTFWGGFSPLAAEASWKDRLAKAAGFLLILAGSTGLVLGILGQKAFPLSPSPGSGTITAPPSPDFGDWLTDEETAFGTARSTGRPVLIDFFADWCAACHELDEKTWPDPAVRDALKDVVPLRIDLTRTDARSREIQARYRIVGMPTVVLLDAERRELRRFEGFLPPERVVRFLESD